MLQDCSGSLLNQVGLGMNMILLSISGVLALIYGAWFSPRGASWPKSAVKTVSVGLLAVVAVTVGGPALLILGLLFGAIGDYWLSRDGDTAFLLGLVSFALGHLSYIGLFLQFGAVPDLSGLTVLMVLFAVGMAVLLWPRAGVLRLPVMGYVVIIAVMGVLALGLPALHLIGVGAGLLFVVSDAILACELFVMSKHSRARIVTSRLVWLTYFGAQSMFLCGFALQFPL